MERRGRRRRRHPVLSRLVVFHGGGPWDGRVAPLADGIGDEIQRSLSDGSVVVFRSIGETEIVIVRERRRGGWRSLERAAEVYRA